jgi:hypothetical protein
MLNASTRARCSLRALAAYLIKRFEDLLWTRSHGNVFGQVDPLNGPRAIDEKLRGPCDVVAFRPGATVQEVVAPDHICRRVGENWIRKSHLPAMRVINIDRVHANRGHMHTPRGKIRKMLLKTPQLGVAKRSPMAAIKNQDSSVW